MPRPKKNSNNLAYRRVRYVEFDGPSSSLKTTNEGWAKIMGLNSLEARLAARKGEAIPEMPEVTNIVVKGEK